MVKFPMTAFLQPLNYMMANAETDSRIEKYGRIIQGNLENTIFKVGMGGIKCTPMYQLHIQPIHTCKQQRKTSDD